MKIIEKKCPNCGANLKFKVGEHDVHCEKCRRDFAIEYDEKNIDPEVLIKAKDIQLKMLGDFEKNRKFAKIFITIVTIFIALSFVFVIYKIISQEIDERARREAEQERRVEPSDEFDEMNEEIMRQMEEIQRQMQDNNYSGAGS